MKNIKLYAGLVKNDNITKNRKRMKLNLFIASTLASVTILGITVNTIDASKRAEDGLVKTNIEIVDTINNTKFNSKTNEVRLGDKTQTIITYEFKDKDLRKMYPNIPVDTKDVVIYDTGWVLNDNKFIRNTYTYYLDVDINNVYKENLKELDKLTTPIVTEEVAASISPRKSKQVESLDNYHISQDLNSTRFNGLSYAFQTLFGLVLGFLPLNYAILKYFEYRKCKRNDVNDEELEEIKNIALQSYNKELAECRKNPAHCNVIKDELEKCELLKDVDMDFYNLYYDTLASILNGLDAVETNMFGGKQNVK